MSLFDPVIYDEHLREIEGRLQHLDRRVMQALEDLGLSANTTYEPVSGRLSLHVWLSGTNHPAEEFVRRLEDLGRA